MNTESCIFTSGEATRENTLVKIPLLVFMSEIKINHTPEKIKFSVSFMLICRKNNLFQSVNRHHRKLFFSLVILCKFYDVQRVYWV